MKIKQTLKKSQTLKGIKKDLKFANHLFYLIKRKHLINKYFAENKIKKLQLGSHISTLNGWLCSDLIPETKNCIYLDVTKKFPFDDKSFDYVYSEHLIEHISWLDGLKMLSESFRVLKSGGKIRIATPDLKVLIDLYNNPNNFLNEKYIKWITEKFLNGIEIYLPSLVINNAFRNWRHQFLYDRDLLTIAFQKVGFVDIKTYNYGHSDDETLKGIERHGINIGNAEMANFETLILEATRP
ncbi:MAG: methyltransferase domain-containing protein [Bacteroidales bacterium]|jgi:predicted SAM-dependent methyltransferase